jgi:hypothetical protein
LSTDEDVLSDRYVREKRGLLIYDRDPSSCGGCGAMERQLLAVKSEPTGVGLVDAGEDLYEGRLARAVLSHQRVSLARVKLDVSVREGVHSPERLGHVLQK